MGVRRWIWTRLGGSIDADPDPDPDDWVLFFRGSHEGAAGLAEMLHGEGIEVRFDRSVIHGLSSALDELHVRRAFLTRAQDVTGWTRGDTAYVQAKDVLEELYAEVADRNLPHEFEDVWDVAHFSSVRAAERAVAVLAAADIGSWMREPDPDGGDEQELSVGVKAEDRKKAAKVLEKERSLTGQFRLDDHIAWVRRSRG